MFNNPSVLLLLLILPVFAAFFVWRQRAREASRARLGDSVLVARLTAEVDTRRRLWKSALWLATVTCIIIALARPVWGFTDSAVERTGLSLMIVLDVSTSMNAQDVLPSRLDRAKLAARQLIEARSGDAFGLVIFAGTALVQLPLTTDVNAAITFLDAATSESISRQGTALESALDLALRSLDSRLGAQRVIILMSDGENHQGQPLLAAENAGLLDVPVFTLGYGDSENGAPIPIEGAVGAAENYKIDRDGNLVITRLEETVLRGIAAISGGSYQRAGESGIEMINLFSALSEMEGGALDERITPQRVERFGVFVGLALLLLGAEMLMSDRRRGAVRA